MDWRRVGRLSISILSAPSSFVVSVQSVWNGARCSENAATLFGFGRIKCNNSLIFEPIPSSPSTRSKPLSTGGAPLLWDPIPGAPFTVLQARDLAAAGTLLMAHRYQENRVELVVRASASAGDAPQSNT